MEIQLDNSLYAFSVAEGSTAVVTVTSGELEYSSQDAGPFRSERTLAEGETHEFTVPGLLASYEQAVFELEYPQPEPENPDPITENGAPD